MRPRSVWIAVGASAVAVLFSVGGTVFFFADLQSLAQDAHRRDSHFTVHAFRVLFQVMGGVVLVVAAVATVALWCLWRRQSWAWWFLVVLSAFGSLSVLRPRSPWAVIGAVPAVVAFVALLMPQSRSYVRRTRPGYVDGVDSPPWAGQPVSYSSSDDELRHR